MSTPNGDSDLAAKDPPAPRFAKRSVLGAPLKKGLSQELVNLGTQQQIRSLAAAVEQATANATVYGKVLNVGGWELKFGVPRSPEKLPALIHGLQR